MHIIYKYILTYTCIHICKYVCLRSVLDSQFVQAHLNVPVNHYLKNVGIPSSLYIPVEQKRNVLLGVQGQCLLGTRECPDGMP